VVAVTGETADSLGNQGKAYLAAYDTGKPNPPSPHFTELRAARGFADGQGSYNLGVAIDPTNAKKHLCRRHAEWDFLISRDGGSSFTPSSDRLHV